MELKQIPTEKILANFSQPREKFDREKIKELAESILSNGLINPITVREDPKRKGKYMIVAGERRWRAHRLANKKKIDAFVKKYKNDGQWMIESLIENVHRDNLEPLEKAKYLKKIKDIENIPSNYALSERVKMREQDINHLLAMLPYRKQLLKISSKDSVTLGKISQIQDKKTRDALFRQLEKGESTRKVYESIPIIKKAPEDVKKALLDDKINTEQAERISRLKTEKQREKAIKEHGQIKSMDKNVEKNISNQMSAKEQREFDKRLIQAKTWLQSFRGSVTDSRGQLESTFKVLLIATKFIPVMDDKQKERLDTDLARFLETLEKGTQLAEKIQEHIE